jgi:hypothetical protein
VITTQSQQGLPQIGIIIREESAGSPKGPSARENIEISRVTRWCVAGGLFLVVLSVYVLTSPGRIDIIDGEARYDVAYNWLTMGRPVLGDPWIRHDMAVTGRNGEMYSFYGAPASFFSIPLVWLGLHVSPPDIQRSQFLFALTSPILGAGIGAVLFLFYVELGVSLRKALAWAIVSSFATMLWPLAASTFDNEQHAFFALSAAYLGLLSGKRRSRLLALFGGLLSGILILYQEYFLLIVPALALSTLDWRPARENLPEDDSQMATKSKWSRWSAAVVRDVRAVVALVRKAVQVPGEERVSCNRYVCFLSGTLVGLMLWFAYNDWRFGSFFDNGRMRFYAQHNPVWGNPVAGFLTLLISPGLSIFLYSPPIVLGILGIRSLRCRKPEIALLIVSASSILVLFLSCIRFVGGGWCWGPRYLTVLLPLWALTFPFMHPTKIRREIILAIVGLGFLVQAMALSVENQRFFFERDFPVYFWAEDPWVYFKHSALASRVGEMLSLKDGPPATARYFNSIPVPDWCTYAILGPPAPGLAPTWMRNFKIYYLPRPWPLWMWWISRGLRPINPQAWLWGLLTVLLVGLGLIYKGFVATELRLAKVGGRTVC